MSRALTLAALLLFGCEHTAHTPDAAARSEAVTTVLPRTSELATYPCMARCHQRRTPNPEPRALREFHAGRVVRHGPALRWCGDCHDLRDLDHLRTLHDEPVSFDEAFRVCGQCHAARLHDWERGIHGLQTGHWSGPQQRRSCTVCHDPHDPHRPTFQALPPPGRDRSYPEGPHR